MSFHSSDQKLEDAFAWAQQKAMSYRGDPTDPVGAWYEAALPEREAFCMRDLAHMCMGAEILGMTKENKNMFRKFSENISESKDWCTYWEINRYNKPAPADYRNDKAFWYNLPANFDIIDAAIRMYKFTGDFGFIHYPAILDFVDKSMNQYVDHWDLEPSKIMDRERLMHMPENFNPNDAFHVCRGLPSYVESVRELQLGADLIAAEYAGFLAASEIAMMQRDIESAQKYLGHALELKVILNNSWWDHELNRYNTFLFLDGNYQHGEGEAFLLRYKITGPGYKTEQTLKSLLAKSQNMNIETRSYLPMLLFGQGFDREGYQQILKLADPLTPRRDYPEVSFTLIESIVSGLMGIEADARENLVVTHSHLPDSVDAEINHLKVLGQNVSVMHFGKTETRLDNSGEENFLWKACFNGKHGTIFINGKPEKANVQSEFGYDFSWVQVEVKSRSKVAACLKCNR